MLEWKNLGDICEIKTGRGITQKDCSDNGTFPVISGGVLPLGMYHTYNREANTVTISRVGDAGIVSFITERFYLNDKCFSIIPEKNDDINTRFLYFYLKSIELEIKKLKSKGGVPTINTQKLSKLDIPVPSLSEQSRIVSILDTFTDSIDNLKQQIEQRRKQYEHYRDQLLDLEGKEGVEMKKISDVAKSFTGLTYKPENVRDCGTLVLRSSNINEDTLSFDDNVFVQMDIPERAVVRENDLLICVRNGSKRLVGKCAMITKEADGMAFGAFMTILRSFCINSKYLFYVWQSQKVKKQYKGDEAMPIAQIIAKDFQRIIIPVPSLEEQSRIVSILDTFEASIANLEEQLKLREKQYEYYRNKLLTFN